MGKRRIREMFLRYSFSRSSHFQITLSLSPSTHFSCLLYLSCFNRFASSSGFFSPFCFDPHFVSTGVSFFFCFFFHNRLCLEESVSLFACFCEWSALESVFLLLNLMNDEIIVLDLISFEFQWFISLVFFELDLGHTGGLQFSGSSFLNFQMGGWFWAFGLMRYALCMHNTLHKGFWFREFDEKSSVSSLFWKSIMIIITLLYFFYNVLFV